MNTSKVEQVTPAAQKVVVENDSLTVDLFDGRTISVPLAWFPRLLHAKRRERDNWRFIARGEGIHLPDLDENISVENLLLGKSSGESQASFQKWLEQRSGKPNRRFR